MPFSYQPDSQSSLVLFTNISQEQQAGDDDDWVIDATYDIDHLLIDGDGDEAKCSYTSSTGNSESYHLRLDTPVGLAASVPADAVITNIEIQIRGYSSVSADCTERATDVQIANGTWLQASNFPESSPATVTLSYDLATWGITNADAHNFISGAEDLTFHVQSIKTSTINNQVYLTWVKAQVSWSRRSAYVPVVM